MATATTTVPTAPLASKLDLFKMIQDFFDQPILQIVPEIAHLAPIILTVGTAFISLATLNLSLGVFTASSIEALLLYNVISLVSSYFFTPVLSKENPTDKCKSYFQLLTPSRFKSLMEQGLNSTFPNKAIYFMSFASAYCIQSMNLFSTEITKFGPQYSNRPYISSIGAGMFLALYSLYLFMNNCNSLFTLFLTIIIGLLIGILISYQNYGIFGKDAVNLLFIPSLQQRSGMDYICVSSQ